MIAHRLSTVRHADLILVLNHGELVERGTHDDLLDAESLYRQLHVAQSGQDQHKEVVERFERLEMAVQETSTSTEHANGRTEQGGGTGALTTEAPVTDPETDPETSGEPGRTSDGSPAQNSPENRPMKRALSWETRREGGLRSRRERARSRRISRFLAILLGLFIVAVIAASFYLAWGLVS
jgi:ABC-type multidrug transport system ATPase subunit